MEPIQPHQPLPSTSWKARRAGRFVHRGVAAGLVLAATACVAEGGREFRSLGTGGTGGVYYPLGGALASQMSLADSTRQYTAEVTGGSVENVNRVLAGQIDLGFALSVTVFERYREATEEEPGRRLRIVAPLYPNLIHVLVREGAGVGSLGDLRRKRVSVGSPGSGTEQTSRQLLASAGLTYDDVEEQYLSFSESAAALKDGALDAALLSVGYPAAAVLEGTTTGDVRLLPLSEPEISALKEAHPYYDAAEIPPGIYPGVDQPVPTVAMMNWLVARDDLPGEIVALVLNILGGEGVSLERVHEMARQIDLSALERAPAPLHPASEAWR
ncbi:MAG: TAXI family TRAP transporter solute-binding subunit [Gemmatimonadales bacterium]|nr:MAG: TAXI family TRAP transporter solute-binding subunit [Gemmatimonadales bacterium]